MDVQQILKNTLSPDQETRGQAESQLNSAAESNFPEYLGTLFEQLCNDAADVDVRAAAGLAIKNTLSAREVATLRRVQQRWTQDLPADIKDTIKKGVLSSLGTTPRVGQVIAQLIASIAQIELPRNEWPELIPSLVEFSGNTELPDLRKSAIVAIGFICEAEDAGLRAALSHHSNSILTAVVRGAQQDEQNNAIRLASLTALGDSLEFIEANFENEGERNYIMQVICEATQANDTLIQQTSFGCLARIMGHYYRHMRFYMEKALYMLTIEGMKSSDHDLAKLAVEFWCTVCEEEIAIHDQAEIAKLTNSPAPAHYQFAHFATGDVVPVLLSLLVQNEDDYEDDNSYTIHRAAYQCLLLWAQTVGDEIVPHVQTFVAEKLQKSDPWSLEAAFTAFSSCLDGPTSEKTYPLVGEIFRFIVAALDESNTMVQNSAANALSTICEIIPGSLKDISLNQVLEPLFKGLSGPIKVATSCSWALCNYIPNVPAEALNNSLEACLRSLLEQSEQTTNNDLRTALYEVLAVFISSSTDGESTKYIHHLSPVMRARLAHCIDEIRPKVQSVDDQFTLDNMQTSLITVQIAIIRRLGSEIKLEEAEAVMTLLLRILPQSSPQSSTLDTAFSAVGILAVALGAQFGPFMTQFSSFLYQALDQTAIPSLSLAAVGVAIDVTRALREGIMEYSPQIMELLLKSIKNPEAGTDHHPAVIQCFGSIASSLGTAFAPYLNQVAEVLSTAGHVEVKPDLPDEMKMYIYSLWEAAFTTWDDIILSFGEITQENPVSVHLPSVFSHIYSVSRLISSPSMPLYPPDLQDLMISILSTLNDVLAITQNYNEFDKFLAAHAWLGGMLEQMKALFPFPDVRSGAESALRRLHDRVAA